MIRMPNRADVSVNYLCLWPDHSTAAGTTSVYRHHHHHPLLLVVAAQAGWNSDLGDARSVHSRCRTYGVSMFTKPQNDTYVDIKLRPLGASPVLQTAQLFSVLLAADDVLAD